jgi:long-subunit fatty acid transport protein
LSTGFNYAKTGVSEAYQNDLSYSNSSNTVGLGGQYKITPAIGLNLGGLLTMYQDAGKTFNHMLGTTSIPVSEDYSKSTWLLAIGVDIKIGK